MAAAEGDAKGQNVDPPPLGFDLDFGMTLDDTSNEAPGASADPRNDSQSRLVLRTADGWGHLEGSTSTEHPIPPPVSTAESELRSDSATDGIAVDATAPPQQLPGLIPAPLGSAAPPITSMVPMGFPPQPATPAALAAAHAYMALLQGQQMHLIHHQQQLLQQQLVSTTTSPPSGEVRPSKRKTQQKPIPTTNRSDHQPPPATPKPSDENGGGAESAALDDKKSLPTKPNSDTSADAADSKADPTVVDAPVHLAFGSAVGNTAAGTVPPDVHRPLLLRTAREILSTRDDTSDDLIAASEASDWDGSPLCTFFRYPGKQSLAKRYGSLCDRHAIPPALAGQVSPTGKVTVNRIADAFVGQMPQLLPVEYVCYAVDSAAGCYMVEYLQSQGKNTVGQLWVRQGFTAQDALSLHHRVVFDVTGFWVVHDDEVRTTYVERMRTELDGQLDQRVPRCPLVLDPIRPLPKGLERHEVIERRDAEARRRDMVDAPFAVDVANLRNYYDFESPNAVTVSHDGDDFANAAPPGSYGEYDAPPPSSAGGGGSGGGGRRHATGSGSRGLGAGGSNTSTVSGSTRRSAASYGRSARNSSHSNTSAAGATYHATSSTPFPSSAPSWAALSATSPQGLVLVDMPAAALVAGAAAPPVVHTMPSPATGRFASSRTAQPQNTTAPAGPGPAENTHRYASRHSR